MPTIHAMRHTPRATGAPDQGTTDRDDLGTAMGLLRDTRIVLAGTIAERSFDMLVELRRDLLQATRLLRSEARTGGPSGLYGKEYRAGANDALRAARAIGRSAVALERFGALSGGLHGIGWPALEAQTIAALRRAKQDVDQAEAAAYTGTHY